MVTLSMIEVSVVACPAGVLSRKPPSSNDPQLELLEHHPMTAIKLAQEQQCRKEMYSSTDGNN